MTIFPWGKIVRRSLQGMKSVPEHQRDCFKTPAGWMTLEVLGGTLLGLQFQRSLDSKCRRISSYRATILAWFQGAPLPEWPLDLTWASLFEQRVYRAVRRIPRSEVRTYGEVAEEIGSPGGARAVGGAMRRNRICLFIP